jgi:hypothetical protein
MKVLDLQCAQQHMFEGWFGSEADFASQLDRRLVECPLCGDTNINKMLSAPRLNLGAEQPAQMPVVTQDPPLQQPVTTDPTPQALQAAWLDVARRIVAQTEDVGDRFADEARKIHYGESEERGIRGQASRAETEALIEEGVAVLPLSLPKLLKETLQ